MANTAVIKIYSKDKKSLEQFKTFLKNITKKWKSFTFNIKNNKKKRKRITVLKSPHVNKKAQTQFQSIIHSANIKCFSFDLKKNYIILKKIKNHLFPDIKIKINRTIFNKKTKLMTNNLFLPKNLYFYQNIKTLLVKQKQLKKLLIVNKQIKKKEIILKKTLQFLKILDNFGTSYPKVKFCLDSSVG